MAPKKGKRHDEAIRGLLVDGKHMTECIFKCMYAAFGTDAGQYVVLEVLDDDYKPVGLLQPGNF